MCLREENDSYSDLLTNDGSTTVEITEDQPFH